MVEVKKKKKNMKGGDDFSDFNEYYNLLMKNNSGVWNRLRFMSRIENFLELLKKLLHEYIILGSVNGYKQSIFKLIELFLKYDTLFKKIEGKIEVRYGDYIYFLVISVKNLFNARFKFLSKKILEEFMKAVNIALRSNENIDILLQLQGLLLANYSEYNPNKIENSIIYKNFMSMQEIYKKYSAAVLL